MRHHQPLLSYGASGAGFGASPSFFVPLTNTLAATTAPGGATYSFARNAAAYVADWENILHSAAVNEARFVGARRVQNRIAGSSQNLTNGSWAVGNLGTGSVAAAITANFTTDPLGGSTASRLQATLGSTPAASWSAAYQTLAQVAGLKSYVWSVWMKANSGTPTVNLRMMSDGSNPAALAALNVTLTSSWQRFSTAVGTNALADNVYIAVGVAGTSYGGAGNTTTAIDIAVWGAQLEEVSGQSNTNSGDYVSVGVAASPYHGAGIDGVKYFATKNGNTVAAGVVTEAVGAAINTANGGSALTTDATGPFGLLIETGRSQLLTNSETFDNAAWTKFNSTVTANSTAGPAGISNADSLVENTTNDEHSLRQNKVKVSSSITYTFSVYAKKGTRDWFIASMDDGTTNFRVWFNLNTGATGTSGAGSFTATSSTIAAAGNGFYRLTVTGTTTGTTTIAGKVMPASADGVYQYVGVAAAVASYVFGAQLETGAFATHLLPDGTIASGGDGFSFGSFATNASATVGTAYAEASSRWSTSPQISPVIGFGAAATNCYPLYNNTEAATIIRAHDGTTSLSKSGISSMQGTVRKLASSWTGSTLLVTGAGAAAASGTFDGNMGSTAIAVGAATDAGLGYAWNGTIRNVKLYTVAATAAELASMTT